MKLFREFGRVLGLGQVCMGLYILYAGALDPVGLSIFEFIIIAVIISIGVSMLLEDGK